MGTGCVIDSEGNASAQIDVILYEQQLCPVFKFAEDIGYYPCESVIAVGEIKSTIGKKELGDIYEKVASVRKLNRFPKPVGKKEPPAGKVEYRTYLDKTTRLMDGDRETIQNSSSRDTLNKAWFDLNCVFRAVKVVRTAVWELLARTHP